MQAIVLLPLLVPFVTAICCLLLRRSAVLQNLVSLAGSVLLFASAVWILLAVEEEGMLVHQAGGWASPYGITVAVDMLSALMILVSAFLAMMVNLYAFENINRRRKHFGYFTFFHFLLMGVNGAFMAGDIFNLYVWFEVMLITSFVLLVIGNTRLQLVGGVKYMLLNFIASSFLLTGVGMIYGLAGSLNMADVARQFQENSSDPMVTVASIFFLFPFAIKAAMFPLFFWLPASYPHTSISTLALFSGLLTKVGVYALLRFFTLVFVQDVSYTHNILLVGAGFTMLSGVLGAVAQVNIRNILSIHIISQIGYLIMGLGLFTPLALAGSIFYLFHLVLVKANLFLIGGVVEKIKGSSELESIGGLYRKYPIFSVLFLISALSLAGLPPLSGFWAKFILIKAGLEVEAYLIVAVSIITGLLTLFSMIKIWNSAFWHDDLVEKRPEEPENEQKLFVKHWKLMVPITLLVLGSLLIGLYSAPLMKYSQMAADQLMDPSAYIERILQEA